MSVLEFLLGSLQDVCGEEGGGCPSEGSRVGVNKGVAITFMF